jgi:type IV secretion system protein VirB5
MRIAPVLVALSLYCTATASHAQWIVLDPANLMQSIQQVMNDITQINNQVRQLTELRRQADAMTGSRNLGTVYDDPSLRNYLPPEAYRAIEAVNATGYAGLRPSARSARDQGMVYNCLDLAGQAQRQCQAELAVPYQYKGMLEDAMRAARGRLTQVSALMRQIDATADQKAVQEIQARIGAENAMLAHEISQIQMLQGLAQSDERIERSRERERQYEMLGRTGKISDFLR